MNKFKVGDRCKYKSLDGYIGTVVFVNNGNVAVRFDNKSHGTSFYCDGKQIEHGWWLDESSFEILPHTNKIVITQSDNRTIARLYNDNKVIKSSEAKYSPTDTYDFATGAKLAFEKLMPASEPKQAVVEEKKTEDKHETKYRVGEKVKVVSGLKMGDTSDGLLVESSMANLKGNVVEIKTAFVGAKGYDRYLITNSGSYWNNECFEPYTETTTPKETIARLYCVKDFEPNNLSKNTIYEVGQDGKITYNDGTKSHSKFGSPAFDIIPEFLIPLVQRPAKVGEWVYVCRANPAAGKHYDIGDIYKVENTPLYITPNSVVITDKNGRNCTVLHPDEYLVLDGYNPEPAIDPLDNYEWVDGYKGFDADLKCRNYQYEIGKEYDLGTEESMCNKGFHFCKTLEETHQYYTDNGTNRFCKVSGLVKKGTAYDGKYCARKIKVLEEIIKPTYYNGKVVCVDKGSSCYIYTVGKVYLIKDGRITCDDGSCRPSQNCNPVKSFKEWQEFSASKWVECKGEAL